MAKKRIQVAFRVDADLYKRIQVEAVEREITIQDMFLDALKLYFQTPKGDKWDYAISTFVQHGDEITEAAVEERQTWASLCWRYINKMPREKVEILISALQWDLLMQKSSRRKTGLKRGVSELTGEKD